MNIEVDDDLYDVICMIAEKIKEAKTDEEVHNIINDIIALNNNRVQND